MVERQSAWGCRVCFNGSALDCYDREATNRVASTGVTTSVRYKSDARESGKAFGHPLPEKSLRRLMDNGAAYAERETRWFARELNLEPGTTAVSRACGMPE